jgi:hypothetical protein
MCHADEGGISSLATHGDETTRPLVPRDDIVAVSRYRVLCLNKGVILSPQAKNLVV